MISLHLAARNPDINTHLLLRKSSQLQLPYDKLHLDNLTVEALNHQKNTINPQIKNTQLIKSAYCLLLAAVLIGVAVYLSFLLFPYTFLDWTKPSIMLFSKAIGLSTSIYTSAVYAGQIIYREINNVIAAYQTEKQVAATIDTRLAFLQAEKSTLSSTLYPRFSSGVLLFLETREM